MKSSNANNSVGENNKNQTQEEMSLEPFKKLMKQDTQLKSEESRDLVDLYLTDAVKTIITEAINHETFNASEYAQMDGNEIKVNITFNISMSMDDLVNSKNVK